MNEKNGENSVRSIQRAFKILLCFNWNERELTLTEITEKIGLAKSTVSRLLGTLETEGFLVKDGKSNRYKLGHNIYYLGLIAKESLDLRAISHSIMVEITKLTQETTNLYMLDNLDRICFDQVESPLSIKRSVKIGERFPVWAGATGKSILAHMDESVWQDMTKELRPLTEKTIIDPQEFINELKAIRANGYAVSVGEKDYEVGCVAAPIFDANRNVIGCISISGPSFRFPKDTDYFCSVIVNAARRISKQLGYYEKSLEHME